MNQKFKIYKKENLWWIKTPEGEKFHAGSFCAAIRYMDSFVEIGYGHGV